jgi:hypothetical protein
MTPEEKLRAAGGTSRTFKPKQPKAESPDDGVEIPGFDKPSDAEPELDGAKGVGALDAGAEMPDSTNVPPREWLLGTVFCRAFLSSLIAGGATGKTALRLAQVLALATGRPLTGEYVHQRCKVLFLTLEDSIDELWRRLAAAMLYHKVTREEIRGRLYVQALGSKGWKLATVGKKGQIEEGELESRVSASIRHLKIDLAVFDPFVKSHSVGENDNAAIDHVATILARMAEAHNCAIDAPHHVSKGVSDPGNADRSRGASAFKDAGRLVYTMTVMQPEEAESFGVSEAERRSLVRVDSAKINLAPPSIEAKWFRLVGVRLGNATDRYPNGDEVQTVEPWMPPDTWAGLSNVVLNAALSEIDAGLPDGQRYSDAGAAKALAAWRVIQKQASGKTEKQCREIVRTWLKNGVLFTEQYHNPVRREATLGLRVNHAKRPS